MAKRPTEAALRAQKDAKQKKVLFLLVPVFLALMAWQGPKTYKAFTGSSAATPPPVTSTTTTPSAEPGSPTPSSGEEASLPESDARPELLEGQLISFSRFRGRDPFSVSGSSTGAAASSDAPAAGSGATIEVNGTSESVSIGGSFPAGEPTFTLVSVTAESASIGLVSGTFSNGEETISVNVGETLVLVADDGARYAIKLVGVAAG